ncbi:exosortase/archaeosortase family protein [Chloroflexota bacterium]
MMEKVENRIKEMSLRTRKQSGLFRRMAIWLIVSLSISFIFFREFWASLGTLLSPDWIFGQHHATSWGILLLCAIALWLKRKIIWKKIEVRPHFTFTALGISLTVGAVLIPFSRDFLVLQALLASLGVFVILFGKAAKIPIILLGIYGFVVAFPLIIERFAELPYAMSVIRPLAWVLTILGYPFLNQGQLMHFTSNAGESISIVITAACAGPATMGVFLAIFALMMFDIPLPPKKAIWIFLFGVTGTWVQSIIRLIIVFLVGYQWGEEAVWTTHSWTIYILFPAWYLLFVYVYFRQAGRPSQMVTGEVKSSKENQVAVV